MLAENARHALDYVARGEVDAGIVYVTDLRLAGDRVRPGPRLAENLHPPIAYEAIVLRGASRAAEVAAFLDWLASPAGRPALAAFGFAEP